MAGLRDVETAFLAQIVATFGLPSNYTANTLAAASALGINLRAFRGWPVASVLDADILAGAGQVSVYPGAGMARLVTRYLDAETATANVPTITATVATSGTNATVTFGGTVTTGQAIGLEVTLSNDGMKTAVDQYLYRPTGTDTLASIAAGFASAMAGGVYSGTASGATITLAPNVYSGTDPVLSAIARVAADQTVTTELRRVQQAYRVGLWMPTPDLRDAAADALDAAMAASPFLFTAAGEAIRVTYHGTQVVDAVQRDRFWRRDLAFMAEYPTTSAQTLAAMLFGTLNVTPGNGDVLALVA